MRSEKIILTILLYPFIAFGQFEAVFYESIVTDTLFSLRKSSFESNNKEIIFPPYEYGEFHSIGALEINNNNSSQFVDNLPVENNKNTLAWARYLNNPIEMDLSNTILSTKLYLENIDKITVFIYSEKDSSWYSSEIGITDQGFQKPMKISIKDIVNDNIDVEEENTFVISKIGIAASFTQEKATFIINDFLIANEERQRLKVKHKFFDDLLNQKTVAKSAQNYELIYKTNSLYENSLITGTIFIEPINSKSYNEKKLIFDSMLLAIDYYPFYKEKKLKRSRIKHLFRKLWNKIHGKDICAIYEALNSFIKSNYNDAHFGIQLNDTCQQETLTEKKVFGPVRAVFLNQKYTVAAVLDPNLGSVKVGSIIERINDKQVHVLVDSLMQTIEGPEERKMKIVERELLANITKDSTKISFRDKNNQEDSTFLKYNSKLRIPENFKLLKHGEFKTYGDSASYFSIKNWYLDAYLKFMNHKNELEKSEKIIIDLRGNGGGEDLSSIRLFSVFINKPEIYSKTFLNGNVQDLLVKPNPYINLSDKSVIILGDWLTACSSESFIMAMLQLSNVQFISTQNTYGSLAARYNLVFPSENIIYVNGLAGKNILMGSIEDRGIKPERVIIVDDVYDLLPYNDKVLSTALKY